MKKIAVMGFGFMGVTHAKHIINSDDLELCGIIENKAGDIFSEIEKTGNHGELDLPLKALKGVPVFRTLEDCLDNVCPDAVSICLPLFLHYEYTKKALTAGLDVLLEKPFCPDVAQCRELIRIADQHNRILMVAHCVRFSPAWEFLAECINKKTYGMPKLFSTCRITGEPAWGIWQDEKIKKTCGGSLMDLLIHDIDFSVHCFGYPEHIKVHLNTDEYWEIQFKYKTNSTIASINGGFLHRHSPFSSEYTVQFENASLRFNSLQPGLVHIGTEKGAESVEIKGDAYLNEINYFKECIMNRKMPDKCPPQSSMQVIEICNKIKELKKLLGERLK